MLNFFAVHLSQRIVILLSMMYGGCNPALLCRGSRINDLGIVWVYPHMARVGGVTLAVR